MTNRCVYIHEFIDIIGHHRADYMHHMTANWCPEARKERTQLCFGVWGTVGSTGRWPEVVNMWELPDWDGLVADFSHELARPSLQDPTLAAWWAKAAKFRRGGVDRILVPEPDSLTITEHCAAGTRGAVYAHELMTLPVEGARAFLDAYGESGRAANERAGAVPVGAFRVALVNGYEAIVISAFESWDAWGDYEQAWEGGSAALAEWRATLQRLDARVQRTLLVDAPLSPLRTGRQPQESDRTVAPPT